MSVLAICREDGTHLESSRDMDVIASQLHAAGVLFERWEASRPLSVDASQEDIIAAYRSSVDRLMRAYDFKSADVISIHPEHPQREVLRQKFLSEHTHSDFEVRFFVGGRGLFYIHAGDRVHCVLCEQGDLISVPAHTKHWFDMGEYPELKCIRLFTTPEGWVADYTGSDIATSFPTLDAFRAQYA